MSLQGFVRWFFPKDEHFFDYLEQIADAAHEAAQVLLRFKNGESAAAVGAAVQELEHKGDKVVHQMEEALAKTFVTPLEREDLQNLAVELDDILDRTNAAVRASALYGVERPTAAMEQLMESLVACTSEIQKAVPHLRAHAYGKLIEASRLVRQHEKEADTIFRKALSDLFADATIDARRLLREKEVLEDLEKAVDRCERAAETLANLAVKHG